MTSVGDVIQSGQPIPDDVTGVEGGAKSQWRLTPKGHWHLRTAQVTCLIDDCGVDGYGLMRASGQRLTVTAVREQPAEEEGRRQDWVDRLTAQPDPLVLRPPEVPSGTVALVGVESGERRESPGLGPNGRPYWCGKDGLVWQLGAVLDMEPGGVRVELAPPREPRTWPKLDPEPDRETDLPTAVTVDAVRYEGVWKRAISEGDCFVYPGRAPRTLLGLRELGNVTEVFDDEAGTQ